MTDINWGILNPNNVGNVAIMAQQGFAAGQQARKQAGVDGALQSYIQNPDDPNVVGVLAKYDVPLALKIKEDQQGRAAGARKQQLMQKAYGGDRQAMSELFGIEPDLVMKMDGATKQKVGQAVDFIAQAALSIDQMPEQQRPQAWANYVRMAESRGMDIPTEYEQYSPEVLQGAMAEAKMVKSLLDQRQPRYQVVPEGGMLVNTNDPAALAQVGGGAPQEQAAPSGQPGEAEVVPIIQKGMQGKFITPEELATIEASQGPT